MATDPERVADDYASDMLIPRYLLDPLLREVPRPTLKAVRELAEMFRASLTATAIKVAESDRFPMIVVCHGQDKRRWFRRSPSVPDRWFPRDELDHESYAFDLLFREGEEQGIPRKVGTDDWFERAGADRFEVTEQSYKVPGDQVITILHLTDPEMAVDWGARHRDRDRQRLSAVAGLCRAKPSADSAAEPSAAGGRASAPRGGLRSALQACGRP